MIRRGGLVRGLVLEGRRHAVAESATSQTGPSRFTSLSGAILELVQ